MGHPRTRTFQSFLCPPLLVTAILIAGGLSTSFSHSSWAEEARPTAEAAIRLLAKTPAGRTLLLRAQKFWNEEKLEGVLGHLVYGPVSRTDAILTRHFNPSTGEEVRERSVTVVLKREQSLEEMALDLAHELTHAVTQPSWDPYDPKLTAGRYIWAALEAEGGEVHAVSHECQVALEFAQISKTPSARCERYFDRNAEEGTVQVNRDKVRKDFYRVGRWSRAVKKRLGDEAITFPLLSSEAPELYSATGGAPYPVALIREYDELNRVACDNVRKRMRAQTSRAPASLLSLPSGTKAYAGEELLSSRCQNSRAQSVTPITQSSQAPTSAPVRATHSHHDSR